MTRYELRKYITYGQLIIWPRLIISIRDHVVPILLVSAMDRDERRSIRCTSIKARHLA
ncbi:hypothetical protein [Vulcanisaeta souniana]|uniref:Uncharacterized protein n=1 Tax=Vulcanisaeta souniana JCM 11219 TaxID=1293586 RepID=A0A830E3L6_9CREN|nr:hypothetical protein [Vulcanisaeta souniana]BDR93256.1 hypothetical protein Vsou_23490 [Vulcanisaeta souniana JCM 11219]GGI78796.1 hypothetical protein GCM10007112_14560 [Vulcanisaeta souniana JCM 11219]